MRVWYITMQFPVPSEAFATSDVLALQKAGLEVSVHSLRAPRPDAKRLLKERGLENLEVTHGSIDAVLGGVFWGIVRPEISFPLAWWIIKSSWRNPLHLAKSAVLVPRVIDIFRNFERSQPDIVHLFWGHFPSMVGYLVKRRQATTVLSIFLGAYDLLMGFRGSREVAQAADVVWTHAGCNVPDIEAFGVPKEKILICYRGTDFLKRQPKKIPKVKRRIIVASRLIKTKRIDRVLYAFRRILDDWADSSLVVLGDGPEKNNLKLLSRKLNIDHALFFKGHVPHDVVYDEMLASEVFLLLSEHCAERLPNVLKEAMACRCIGIVTHSPGIEELIENGRTGFIVSPDLEDVAGRVNEVFSNTIKKKILADNAYEYISSKFDVDRSMSYYKEVWKVLVLKKDNKNKMRMNEV